MKIELHIDVDRITIDDLIMVDELQAGNIPARQLKEFVAKFVYADGAYLPEDEAFKMAGKLTVAELRQSFAGISETVKELQATAVPPEISGG